MLGFWWVFFFFFFFFLNTCLFRALSQLYLGPRSSQRLSWNQLLHLPVDPLCRPPYTSGAVHGPGETRYHTLLPPLFLLMLLAISCWKRFSLYVFVANLYVLFMLSWWCISELILPSRKMKSLINFPLYSLEQNYTGFELVTQVVLK